MYIHICKPLISNRKNKLKRNRVYCILTEYVLFPGVLKHRAHWEAHTKRHT